jgi:hypothetical protein
MFGYPERERVRRLRNLYRRAVPDTADPLPALEAKPRAAPKSGPRDRLARSSFGYLSAGQPHVSPQRQVDLQLQGRPQRQLPAVWLAQPQVALSHRHSLWSCFRV